MAAAAEEDDYMSDSVLKGTSDIRPGLLHNKAQKRSHDLSKKKDLAKKSKTYAEKEKETRQIGLETPLPAENKGFQLLMKMGFKPGDKIGTSADSTVGLSEPIKVVTKESKTGLGHEADVAEKVEMAQVHREKLIDEFRAKSAEKKTERLISFDYERAQRICEDMDSRSAVPEPEYPWYWPKPDEEGVDPDEEPSPTTVALREARQKAAKEIHTIIQNLPTILQYLRNTYYYCIYCVIKYKDMEDMLSNCPGPTRVEHEH